MSPETSRKVDTIENDEHVSLNETENEGRGVSLDQNDIVDWTTLTKEMVIDLFSRLSTRDRMSLSSICKTWRDIGSSPFLWQSLDVRAYNFDATIAHTLASRCMHLSSLRFNDAKTPHPIMNLNARNLKEIIGYRCKDITDATLSGIIGGYPCLETLQLGPKLCNITSDSIKTLAFCCPKLRKLKLSGIRDVNKVAINALATCCRNLVEIGFIDCLNIDEVALGNVLSLRFLSVAGTINMCWVSVSNCWTKLPNLLILDISRTNVDRNCVSMLLLSASGLRVLCALECPLLPVATEFSKLIYGDKNLLIDPHDLYIWICSSVENMKHKGKIQEMKFRGWRNFFIETEMGMIMDWLECVFSQFFLWDYQINPVVDSDFWYGFVPVLLFSLLRSPQEEVVEMGMQTLSIIISDREESTHFSEELAKKVPQIGDVDIGFLLYHSRSHQEGLQLQAVKAIANLSTYSYFRVSIISQGGLAYLSGLTKSKSKLVVKAAAKGLFNLSESCNYQLTCFIEAGGIEALVDLLSKWPGNEYVLRVAAGAVANLASHKTCAAQILSVGGVNALLVHAFDSHFPQVSEQALRALAQLCRHGNNKHFFSGTRKVATVVDNLVQLTQSIRNGIRLNAADVLHNMCCYGGDSKAFEEAGVIEAFVALAQRGKCPAHQQKAANFLLEFSSVKENSISVGERGGIAVLIALTQSNVSEVRDHAVRALCHLSFLPCNALHIKVEKGVRSLIEFCKLTQSKAGRFYSALALACMHDERMVEYEKTTGSISGIRKIRLFWNKESASNYISDYIPTVCDPIIFSFVAASPTSSMLEKQAKALYIEDAGCKSSVWVIERLISLLRDSSSDIKACAAFALVQYTTPCNIYRMKNTKFVQEAGGLRILRALAASKYSPNSVKVLSKIVLFCLEKNQSDFPSTSHIQRREKRKKTWEP